MGSALAQALLAAGHGVTVWNRTSDKAAPLVDGGARLAGTITDAVVASPVSLVCLRGYDVTLDLLDEAGAAVEGRVVVQLGGGSPQQVQEVAALLAGRGCRYLDGSIFGFPQAIGSSECQILVSGDSAAYEASSELLNALAGEVRYLGEVYTAAATVEVASAGFLYAAAQAFVVAAAMGDAAGAPVDVIAGAVSRYCGELPPLFGEFAEMIEAGEYGGPNLRLASGIENLGGIIELGRAEGVDVSFLEAAHSLFQATADADYGNSVAAVYETVRNPASERH